MKKSILLFLLAFASIIAQAQQIPNDYYDNATGKTGNELRSALHDIIDNHTEISYGQIWNAFWSTDNRGNNVVWDMYSDGASYSYNYYSKTGDQCGTYDGEGDCYNREHSWPKSWFTGKEDCTPGRDLHHIFPTDGFVNAQRSSYPYGEVQSATWTSENGSKLGSCKSSLGYTGTVFEPIDQYKGDFARAYFYMSTRYYGEDSNWGSSGMTEGANLKSWAVTMLLRWSDNDPVSQKEIDRNNAVYGIQGNRNPFIDHPEYAHLIWEPGWSGTPYAISCASVQHGSISAPSTAVAGTMVTLSATPSQGYMLYSWNVYKTGDTSTTVTVSDNGTFTMPSFNVTVSATFVQNNTPYSIACASGLAHGSISTNVSSATSGTTVTLSNTPANGYILYSYYVYKTGDLNTIVYSGTGSSFTMPAYNVTVSASFVQPSSYSYVKVTSAPDDWSGDYVLVYENSASSAYVWTGVDAASCYTEKSITDNSIADDGMVSITIAPMTGGYSIKVNGGTNNGKYIYGTSGSNKINFGNSASLNTIAFETEGVSITSNTSVMRYNTAENRFRYYKSSTYTSQQHIQLYKKTGTASAPTHTIQFNPNGASGTSYTQNVIEFEPTALQTNAFTYEGFAFDSWNTEANGSGTPYFNGATVRLLDNLTLYAQWAPTYTITCNPVTNGTITASAATAVAGATITLTATPNTGYELGSWTVTDSNNNEITVTDNEFEMPASNVTVSATFTEQSVVSGDFEKVTENLSDWSGDYLIVYEDGSKAFNGALTTLDANNNAISVDISNNTIEATPTNLASQFTIAKSGNNYTIKSASGYYIGATSNTNVVHSSTSTAYTNSINYSNGSINIIGSGGAYLRYNSGNTRFRYYQSSTYTSQKAIQLYKRVNAAPTTYTVTFYPNGGAGSSYTQTVNANEATALTANTFTRSGYVFSGWNTQADGNGTAYTNQQTVTLTADLNLYAQWTIQSTSYTYHLVTSTDQLVAGRTYLIVNTANQKALGTTQNNNNRSAASVTVGSNMISNIGDDVCELTLGGQSGAWTFYDATKNGYLCATSGSNNYLRTQTTLDNYGKWTITLDASHNATIKTIASGAGRHTIMYNNGNTIFSCYESGQQAVQLYIRSENDITQNTTYQNLVLFDFDQCTIHSGVTLTVTGTATCNDPNNLIIEDGAHFIHHNDGVQATVKKSIEGYSGNSGWYTIATPFTSYNPNTSSEITTELYDLYAYDEDGEKEWINYKAHTQDFTMTPGNGYLYAHNPGTTLNMTGTLNNGDFTTTINLSYANAHESIRGYNLLGNPTAHNITYTKKTNDISDGYYYVSNGDDWDYTTSTTVPAGRGFLVKANATGQSVELNPSSKSEDPQVKGQYLCISVDGEKVYVKMNEGVSMPLLDFHGNKSHLYLTRDQVEYVMLVKEEAESIDLNYQPCNKEQLTLTVSTDDLDLSYLHLIDHLTGTDIDLLVSPSYTFDSKSTDFASRFMLKFAPGGNTFDNDQFAYYKDGQFHLLIDADASKLQIIDAMGRMIHRNSNIASGVYVLRLITPEKIRTQKIVVR